MHLTVSCLSTSGMPPHRTSNPQALSSRALLSGDSELQIHFETGKRYRPYISIQRIRSADIKKQNNNDPRLYYSAKEVPFDRLSVFSLHGGDMHSASLPAHRSAAAAVPVPEGRHPSYGAAAGLCDTGEDSELEMKCSVSSEEHAASRSCSYAEPPLDAQAPNGSLGGANEPPSYQTEGIDGLESSLVKSERDTFELRELPRDLVMVACRADSDADPCPAMPVYSPAPAAAAQDPFVLVPAGYKRPFVDVRPQAQAPAIHSPDVHHQTYAIPDYYQQYYGFCGYPNMISSLSHDLVCSTYLDERWIPFGAI